MGNGDIFVLAAVYLTGLGCKFWVVFCGLWFQYQFHFQRHLQCLSDLSHVYTTQWPVWDQGCDLYHSRVFKVYSILFSVRFTYTQGWAQQSISIFMGSFPKLLLLCDCLSTFLFLGGSPFLSFGQKAGALFIPLCDILPWLLLYQGPSGGGQSNGGLSQSLDTTSERKVPLHRHFRLPRTSLAAAVAATTVPRLLQRWG